MSKYEGFVDSLIRYGMLGRTLHVVRRDYRGDTISMIQPLIFKDMNVAGSWVGDPKDTAMLVSHHGSSGPDEITDFLQGMLDLAWEQGLRPKGFEAPTQELKAVRDHLNDMRKLAKVDNG